MPRHSTYKYVERLGVCGLPQFERLKAGRRKTKGQKRLSELLSVFSADPIFLPRAPFKTSAPVRGRKPTEPDPEQRQRRRFGYRDFGPLKRETESDRPKRR